MKAFVICLTVISQAVAENCEVPSVSHGSLQNGRRTLTAGSMEPYDTVIRLECNARYSVSGSPFAICVPYGRSSFWMPPLGKCLSNTPAPTNSRCSTNQFACANGECITRYYRCDGEDFDCTDNSDEVGCSSQPDDTCRGFTCTNGKCIRNFNTCDGYDDCGDNSDEEDCEWDDIDFTTTEVTGTTTEDPDPTRPPTRPRPSRSTPRRPRPSRSTPPRPRPSRSTPPSPQPPGPTVPRTCGYSMARRIFGGSVAVRGEYPWIAKLDIKFERTRAQTTCGGALISDQWILTAAHCIVDDENRQPVQYVRAHLGRHDLSSRNEQGGIQVQSSTVFVHPDYQEEAKDNWENDFGLVKLDSPVQINTKVRSICLPDSLCQKGSISRQATTIDNCRQVAVAGWGTTRRGDDPDVLRVAEMDIVSKKECKEAYGGEITDAHICVGDGRPSTCSGDSGGPLMCKSDGYMHVIGVVSWGAARCGAREAPSVFSRVCAELDWIKQTMAQN